MLNRVLPSNFVGRRSQRLGIRLIFGCIKVFCCLWRELKWCIHSLDFRRSERRRRNISIAASVNQFTTLGLCKAFLDMSGDAFFPFEHPIFISTFHIEEIRNNFIMHNLWQ